MRTKDQIQKAHDTLVLIATGKVPHPCPDNKNAIITAADVLCWVLEHDHNPTFKDNLDKIEMFLAEHGLEITQTSPTTTKATWQNPKRN